MKTFTLSFFRPENYQTYICKNKRRSISIGLSVILCLLAAISLNAQSPELWGMTFQGGEDNKGNIFKTDANGNNAQLVYGFPVDFAGADPSGSVIQVNNGKIYGMTNEGGSNNLGVLFEFDPATNTYTKKLDFDGASNGANPIGSLMEATNGKLYGMTVFGGTFNRGVLFEYDPATSTFAKKLDFDGTIKGRNPNGSLVQAANGKLYGMTGGGGSSDYGVLFEYDLVNATYTKKLDFDGTFNGRNPLGSLIQASNGKLYGMTSGGGIFSGGVLFEYDPATDTFTKKLDFNTSNGNGWQPFGSLIEATNGKLYGMTARGNIGNDFGVLFEYDPATSTYTKKFDFDGINGWSPWGSLVQAVNGKLYGMTQGGGSNNSGVLFEYDLATSIYTKRLDFDGTSNGASPRGSLLQATDGKLYGMTRRGGSNDSGVLFAYDPSTSTYTKKLDFDSSFEGLQPAGRLVQTSNGMLYGMTQIGGSNNFGVLFEYDPITSTYTKRLDFDGTSNGRNPLGSLIQVSNGKLYGMTLQGGSNNFGVLFEYDPITSTYTKRLDFNGTSNGQNPYGSLVQASNGKLYGMTQGGGTFDSGVLFEYDPATGIYTKRLDFNGTTGRQPFGSLVEAANGKLYGMTRLGGSNNDGVLFEYDPSISTYINKFDFDRTNGENPYGSLIQASNGKLYGMTQGGGSNFVGVLFEYDPATSTYTKKFDFDGINGRNPWGSLVQASNGKLYGMTERGGSNNRGVLFEYDPATNTYAKKLDSDGSFANNGRFDNGLIEVNVSPPQAPFITTWQTTTANESITIPTTGSGYNYTVDWGDGMVDTNQTGNATHTYATAGTHTVSITGDFPRIYFGNGTSGNRLQIVEVNQWGDIEWTSMEQAFLSCVNLNITANDTPNLSNVTSFSSTFSNCQNLIGTSSFNNWDVSGIITMNNMFDGAASFNQNIGSWDVSGCENMNSMFDSAASFNQDLNSWDVSSVKAMNNMFNGATSFNGNIGSWNVGQVESMSFMFLNAINFDQDISSWNVSAVTTMVNMFAGATSFNQDLVAWNVSAVREMSGMFRNATSFDQNIGDWDISSLFSASAMFDGVTLSQINYDNLLNGWATLDTGETTVPFAVQFSGGNSQYCDGEPGKTTLEGLFWTITDGGINCPCEVAIDTQPQDATICDGDALSFDVSASGDGTLSYQWQVDDGNGGGFVDLGALSATSALDFAMMATGGDGNQYQVIVTADNNTPGDTSDDCSVTSSIATLTVNALPTVTANATSLEICEGEEVTLTGGGADTYLWDNGVTDNQAFVPTETTTYTVTGTDANGCENTAEVTV
ncbi:BspA family leucine-rich repeat surface protein, partial [Winogradskyella sp. DF17]